MGCRLGPMHLAQLAGGGLDQRPFVAEDDDRGPAGPSHKPSGAPGLLAP